MSASLTKGDLVIVKKEHGPILRDITQRSGLRIGCIYEAATDTEPTGFISVLLPDDQGMVLVPAAGLQRAEENT